MSLNTRIKDLEALVERRGAGDYICPTCRHHTCWKRGGQAFRDCEVCPPPSYRLITPIGSHGHTDYWIVNTKGTEDITYEDPTRREPPCEECGYEVTHYTLNLGGELEGDYDE